MNNQISLELPILRGHGLTTDPIRVMIILMVISILLSSLSLTYQICFISIISGINL